MVKIYLLNSCFHLLQIISQNHVELINVDATGRQAAVYYLGRFSEKSEFTYNRARRTWPHATASQKSSREDKTIIPLFIVIPVYFLC